MKELEFDLPLEWPLPPLEPFELGYLAGLFDGEGSICIVRQRQSRVSANNMRYQLSVGISNVHLPSLEAIKARFSGRIYLKAGNDRTRPYYEWQITHRKPQANFLMSVGPHLRIKREQAQIAIDFLRFKAGLHRRGQEPYSSDVIDICEQYRGRMRSINLVPKCRT